MIILFSMDKNNANNILFLILNSLFFKADNLFFFSQIMREKINKIF
nr:hypothetical protein BAR15_180212 [Bartonella sp. AR 15-3]